MEMQSGDLAPVRAAAVNWKGLYEDGKAAWISLLIVFLGITAVVSFLTYHGYFTHKEVDVQIETVTVLQEINYFTPQLLIRGAITSNIPTEVKLPYGCELNTKLIGKDIKLTVSTQYKQYNNSEYYVFKDVAKVCL